MIAINEPEAPGVYQVLAGELGQNMPISETMGRLQRRAAVANLRLQETLNDIYDYYVDPRDAFMGDDGEMWNPLGKTGVLSPGAVTNEADLQTKRDQCRDLAMTNGYAINGHENRISYIVGTGHVYTVVPKPDTEVEEGALKTAQAIIDDFLRENKWHRRQQEIVRRRDRDGECFLRFFRDKEGVRLRFVEPSQVGTPADRMTEPGSSFGIKTDPKDVELVLGYWIDEQWTEAREIQHRKQGVDFNVKRGLPLFDSVRMDLIRAGRLQRNMAVVAEVQAAIAMIRKHATGTKTGVESFVQDNAQVSITSRTTGKTTHYRQYGPGTILDATGGVDYEFPSAKVNPGTYVPVLAALLRGVASRLVMPEFMLTSDASNANYSSTMVAEGPAVKMFQRLQWNMIEEDLEVMDRVLDHAVAIRKLGESERKLMEVDVTPPRLETRDRLKEAQADNILVAASAMSTQEMARRHDLDPDKMQAEIEEEREKDQVREPFAGMGFGGQEVEEPEEVPAGEG